MKNILGILAGLGLVFTTFQEGAAQCASDSNIYRFTYQSRTYDVVRELKTFNDAAACAVLKGGYLVHLNNSGEMIAVIAGIQLAGVASDYKPVTDGGGASYVWIGASDKVTEGTWLWDGNNDGTGDHFWTGQGSAGSGGGNAVNAAFVNWGGAPNYKEPDNYNNNQDCAGIALSTWPLGIALEWNDLSCANTLYFVIEYNANTGLNKNEMPSSPFNLQPNPAKQWIQVETKQTGVVKVMNLSGKTIKSIELETGTHPIDISELESGIYFVAWITNNDFMQIQKLIVQ